MIDHLLGRPSPTIKRLQLWVFLISMMVVANRSGRNVSPMVRSLNRRFARYSPVQIILYTLTAVKFFQRCFLLFYLSGPEPLANLYSRSYFRATWITTALDAGFWTAMNLRPKILRDILSLVFTLYYLINPEEAEEKVRKYRTQITVEMMRISWNKPMNPLLSLASRFTNPKLSIKKIIYVKRQIPKYRHLDPIKIHVYYAGDAEDFSHSESMVLNIPGGGFTTMPPPCHENYISLWCKDTKKPIFAVDYKKAPEYPFPYAIEECFDLYTSICSTKGRCLGLNGLKIKEAKDTFSMNKKSEIPISLIGDSAGGNILCGLMFKVIQKKTLPHPKGIIMMYPCLDFNISSWMTKHQVQVFRSQSVKSLKALTEIKDHFKHNSPLSTTNDTKSGWIKRKSLSIQERVRTKSSDKLTNNTENKKKSTQLTMTSRVSYFNDRILTPDMMRAMAILYIGPDICPDFNRDYFISPIVAPEEILAQFPNTYIMCGEKDPFVDDTVLFGGRIRLAKKRMLRKSGIFASNSNNSTISKNESKIQPLSSTNSQSTQNVKFSEDTKNASKFTIGDENENSSSDYDSDLDNENTKSDISTSSQEEIKNMQSTDLLQPIRSYARLFPLSRSFHNLEQQTQSNEKYGVDIKLLKGCSHAFLMMYPFLLESKGSIEFLSSWINKILDQ